MTLKKKLCMITLLCTLATMSLCLSLYCAWQAEEIRTHAETRARDSLKLFCANLESLDRTVPYPDPLTGRSITQYYFATYSHILGGGSFYSLVQEDEYLYNACQIGRAHV